MTESDVVLGCGKDQPVSSIIMFPLLKLPYTGKPRVAWVMIESTCLLKKICSTSKLPYAGKRRCLGCGGAQPVSSTIKFHFLPPYAENPRGLGYDRINLSPQKTYFTSKLPYAGKSHCLGCGGAQPVSSITMFHFFNHCMPDVSK